LEVIITVMTSPYHFYFMFVPRRTSNLREVRFGEVAVLKQIYALHYKNSWKFSEYLFHLKFLVRMPQVISKLLLFLHLSIWSTEGPQKNRFLSGILFWQILPLFLFASRSLSFLVILITELVRKFSEYLFDLRFLVRMPQVISKLLLVLHFSIWATEYPRKNWYLSVVLFWQISATICVSLSIAFFLSSFDHGTFERVATVAYALMVGIFEFETEPKG
jgi:hypothetical protein